MRKEKQLLLDEAKEQFDQYPAFFIISYKGLKANTANEFRGEVAKFGGNVEMLSRRMLHKAAGKAGVNLDLDALEGHLGVVFVPTDPIETAKMVIKFGKSNNKAISVLAGRFPDGQLYNAADVEKLSKLPALPEMRAQFLGTLEAPMSETLAVMEALLTSVIYCIEEKSKQ
jgi:large subunit ribosomal protein L10